MSSGLAAMVHVPVRLRKVARAIPLASFGRPSGVDMLS